jgi:RNA polymerase sigma-70 factor (ECF subfamily)
MPDEVYDEACNQAYDEADDEAYNEAGTSEAILLDAIRSAQHAFPTVVLPPDVFIAYLHERMPTGIPEPVALRQMHTADLYLACACARGDACALATFDAHCLHGLDRVLLKMGIGADMTAEVKQDIRRRVLVGEGGPPQIVGFSGRGDLRSWVRVMAVRQAVRRQGRARREVSLDDDRLLQHLVAPGSPESDHLKGSYRQEFKRAFDAALRALPDRERTLLRQHYIDALTIDELGGLYRVHRATAARLLVRARVALREATRARMMAQLEIPPDDLDSIMRMIRSQMEISLRGLMRRQR